MMSFEHLEATNLYAGAGPDADLFGVLGGEPIATAVAVSEWACWIIEGFGVYVLFVGGVVGAHPTQVIIVSAIGKWKSKTGVARKVPAFIAVHVTLIDLSRPEEREVGIDQQHSVTRLAFRWPNDPPIRPHVCVQPSFVAGCLQFARRQDRVSRISVLIVVVADEGEREPRLHVSQDSRMRLRMPGQVVIEAGGESVAKGTRSRIKPLILFSCQTRDFKRVVQSILIERLLAI